VTSHRCCGHVSAGAGHQPRAVTATSAGSNRSRPELRSRRRVSPALYEAGYGSTSRVYEKAHAPARDDARHLQPRRAGHAHSVHGCPLRPRPAAVATTARGICRGQLGEPTRRSSRRGSPPSSRGRAAWRSAGPLAAAVGVAAALPGRTRGATRTALGRARHAFQRRVWRHASHPLRRHPLLRRDRAAIGKPSATRRRGAALCHQTPGARHSPATVVRADGGLGGYRWGARASRALLEQEQRATTKLDAWLVARLRGKRLRSRDGTLLPGVFEPSHVRRARSRPAEARAMGRDGSGSSPARSPPVPGLCSVSSPCFLILLEWLPLLPTPAGSPVWTPTRRANFLDRLQRAPLLLLRRGLWGVRTLILMGYYGRPAAAKEIGYRARCAAVGRPGGDRVAVHTTSSSRLGCGRRHRGPGARAPWCATGCGFLLLEKGPRFAGSRVHRPRARDGRRAVPGRGAVLTRDGTHDAGVRVGDGGSTGRVYTGLLTRRSASSAPGRPRARACRSDATLGESTPSRTTCTRSMIR